jgi:hypothetical protein
VDPITTRRNQLDALKQDGNVTQYSQRFRQLRMQIYDMSEPEALHRYTEGLKQEVRRAVRIARVTTVEEAMVVAARADDRSYASVGGAAAAAAQGPAPMDLGAMHGGRGGG